ncbi:MAG TPA: tetratricopeptide repeat protein, partial [Candidatus Limnocylindrales bacterium]|nr:tetratricopeptide repeat protein [Candidatus Limnocylindrales bacterium]
QAKRGAPLELEPAETGNVAASTPLRPIAAGVAPGPTLGSAAHRAEQEAARTVFIAKQPPMQNRAWWLLLGGLSLLAIAAGAFWLWYTLSYPSTPTPVVTRPTAPIRPLVVPPPAEPASTMPPVAVPAPPARPTPPAMGAPTPPTAPTVSPTPSPRVASSRSRATPAPDTPATDTPPPTGPRLKASPIDSPAVNPELSAAYTALIGGDYPVARQQYESLLQADPFNLDAWLGIATAAASTGDANAARDHYTKALEIDPRNAVAMAGLAALSAGQDAAGSERQLRAFVAATPDAPAAHSALGHLYAGQARWSDAQQAFFEAYRLDAANPDHAFNLAVALDHLRQTGPARDYYAKALALAASRPAAFSSATVAARMNELAP